MRPLFAADTDLAQQWQCVGIPVQDQSVVVCYYRVVAFPHILHSSQAASAAMPITLAQVRGTA